MEYQDYFFATKLGFWYIIMREKVMLTYYMNTICNIFKSRKNKTLCKYILCE